MKNQFAFSDSFVTSNQQKLRPTESFYRVRLLFLQLATMVLATAIMYLLPLSVSFYFLVLLYGFVICTERRFKVWSPISLALFMVSIALCVGQSTLDEAGYEIYSPVILFGILFLVGAALLMLGRPATSFYGGELGLPELHWKTSMLWVGLYASAGFAGWMMVRYPFFYWLLPALMLAGAVVTLKWQLFDMGSAWRRSVFFTLGRYQFVQIANDSPQLLLFYEHFVREAMPAIKAGIGPKNLSCEQLVDLKMAEDAAGLNQTTFFLAFQDTKVVGTISCMTDGASKRLSFENGHSSPIDLQQLRNYGRVVEIGRFSISKDHRLGQDVIQGLMRCAVEFSLEKDASFLVTQSYLAARPIYRKIGFQALDEKIVHQRGIGTAVQLLFFNLTRRLICDDELKPVAGKLQSILSPYLAERYFKRQALRALFYPRQAWQLSDSALSALVMQAAAQEKI
jgi:predicted GNAT family N-acyltransferase